MTNSHFTTDVKIKNIFLLQLEDSNLENPNIKPPDLTHTEYENAELAHHLSLNTIRGALGTGTIRFTRQVSRLLVQILINGGSSDSFLQPRITHLLHLPIEPGPHFKVFIGNGQTMVVERMIPELSISVQGHILKV